MILNLVPKLRPSSEYKNRFDMAINSSRKNSFFTINVIISSAEAEIMEKHGVKVIIALGHSGYTVDMDIAKNCPLVDVVVGGHSHSFLYSGDEPLIESFLKTLNNESHIERIVGPYPTVVTQASGKRVPVVQAYAFTKYMGELKLKVSQNS